MTMYAAAPRGIKLDHVSIEKGRMLADFGRDGGWSELYPTFKEAWDDAVFMSMDSSVPYEVMMFDDNHKPIGHSAMLASYGVEYEMVEEDELATSIAEHEGAIYE